MVDIWKAVSSLAVELHPDQSAKIAHKIGELESWSQFDQMKTFLGSLAKSKQFKLFEVECKAAPNISPQQVSAALVASSVTADLLYNRETVEMVWTGPFTGVVSSRHTEQVLLEVISAAQEELFIVSFVAYDIDSIRSALTLACERGVRINILLEQSKKHGGKVDIDSVKTIKSSVPSAKFYTWKRSMLGGESLQGAVHAKCAVADGRISFITSANLTRAAMENNMELGVLIRGHSSQNLHRHLKALIFTKLVDEV